MSYGAELLIRPIQGKDRLYLRKPQPIFREAKTGAIADK